MSGATTTKRENWVPANGGTEEPFAVRGFRIQYLWETRSGRHAYIDLSRDVILSDEEALGVLTGSWESTNFAVQQELAAVR